MLKKILLLTSLLLLTASAADATPGEYSLYAKAGPSFGIDDHDDGFKVGGEFDYELGFGFGFNLSSYFGFGDTFLIQAIPAVKYDILYFVPGSIFVIAGAGWELYDSDESALGMRLGTGIRLPLKKPLEFITDVNFFITPAGTTGTPISLDWLTGIGLRY